MLEKADGGNQVDSQCEASTGGEDSVDSAGGENVMDSSGGENMVDSAGIQDEKENDASASGYKSGEDMEDCGLVMTKPVTKAQLLFNPLMMSEPLVKLPGRNLFNFSFSLSFGVGMHNFLVLWCFVSELPAFTKNKVSNLVSQVWKGDTEPESLYPMYNNKQHKAVSLNQVMHE